MTTSAPSSKKFLLYICRRCLVSAVMPLAICWCFALAALFVFVRLALGRLSVRAMAGLPAVFPPAILSRALFVSSLVVVVGGATGCGSGESVTGMQSSALQSGAGAATCPDGSRPTLRATGVGLRAVGGATEVDSRCLVEPLAFTLPYELEIVKGSAKSVRASLSFREASSGRTYRCDYRSNGPVAGSERSLPFGNCTGSLRAGLARSADWVQLSLDTDKSTGAPIEVRVHLGSNEPANRTVISASSTLSGAALELPSGAASDFEHFALDAIPGAEPGTPINLGIHGASSVGAGAFVSALDRGPLAALPASAGGAAYRLTLPYDPAQLAAFGASESDIFVYEISEFKPWQVPTVLAIRRDIEIDSMNHTVTLPISSAVGFISAVKAGARRIPFNGGPVMTGHVPVHIIYYGTWTTLQKNIVEDLLSNLGGSDWLGVLNSYNDSSGSTPSTDVVLGQTYVAPNPRSPFPTDDLSAAQGIVKAAVDGKHLPSDDHALYLVMLGNDITGDASADNACGWHSSDRLLDPLHLFGPIIKFGVIRNPSNIVGGSGSCYPNVSTQPNSPNGDREADAMATVIAHEIAESLSDPEGNSGWSTVIGKKDVENADNCAWLFGQTYKVGTAPKQAHANVRLGARDYLIQQDWVNIGSGYGYCSMRVEDDQASLATYSTTLPDPPAGENVRPMIYGKQYSASFSYANSGDSNWRDDGPNGEQYALGSQSPQDNDLFGVGGRVSVVGRVTPGSAYTFTFPFSAASLPPGLPQTFQWRMVREAVRWFGDPTPPIIVRPVFNSSELVAHDVPFVHTDDSVDVSVTFRNTSGAAWRAVDGYFLQLTDFRGDTQVRLAIGESIEPGASRVFSANIAAPSSPGTFPIRLQMAQDGLGRFGPALEAMLNVVGVDRGQFVSQTVPSAMELGLDYEVRATFRNTGTSTWGPSFRLAASGPFTVKSSVVTSVAPGAQYEVVALLTPTSPNAPLPAQATLNLALANGDNVIARGDDVTVEIRQGSGVTLAECTDFNVPDRMIAGQIYRVINVMRNAGGTTWTTDYYLGSTPPGDTTWGVSTVPLTQRFSRGLIPIRVRHHRARAWYSHVRVHDVRELRLPELLLRPVRSGSNRHPHRLR